MKPSTALHRYRARILDLVRQHGLQNVRLFGSVLHGKDTEDSDLDLLVDAPPGITLLDIIGLQQAIEDETGVNVDVLTALDLPPSFRERVLHEAQPL